MTRRLLPYEHDLIATLGVTEEEYLDFLSIQETYSDPKEGTIVDVRNMPALAAVPAIIAGTATAAATAAAIATLTTISISLTVVGILFQVASVLLADKPSSPKAGRNQREQRFSPRFGFNSGQELAQYGDPINLVYCNTSHNPLGGVRIGTSLVWSSVESYGSTQFMQLLLVLGAASIKTLDFERTAFGQLPLGQFSESNTWLYYEDNGPVNFNDKLLGDGKDPTRDGAASSEDVCRVMFAKSRRDGYSQAFSPSSLTSIGVYDPIPLNIEIQERRNSGKPQWGNLQITIEGGNYGTGGNVSYAVGNQITVVFAKAAKRQQIVVKEAAKDMRYQLAESLDRASTYMLGTAKFRLVSVNGGEEVNLDDNDVRAKFECIEAGRRPVTEYTRTRTKIWNESDREELQDAKAILNDPLTDAEKTAIERLRTSSRPDLYARISPTVFVDDYTFTVAAGRTSSGVAGLGFAGQVDSISGGDFVVKLQNFGFQDYKFTGSEVVNWTDELDKKQTLTIPKGGSIAVTRKILRSFLANKPKLDVAALRDEIEDDLEKLRQVIDDLNSGDLDGEFREAARQAASSIRKSIRERQKEIQKILDEIGLNKKDVKVQKTGGGNADVLDKNTDIKKDLARIESKNDRINELQEERDEIMSNNKAKAKKALIQFYRNTNSPFTALGNRYGSGGIKAMKRRLAQLKGQRTTDQTGVKKVRDFLNELIKHKEDARNAAKLVLKDWEDFIADADDDFFTKCLVKIESAAYQTVTACDFVKFAIRCKLFRRISGRAKDYGDSEAPDGYRLSDNGIHGRMAFFKVSYKETGASTYQGFPVVFAVRRGTDQDNFIGLAFKGPSRKKWEFKFDPIGDISAETRSGETHIAFIENEGRVRTFTDGKGATFGWTGALKAIPSTGIHSVLKERGPLYTNEWDLFSNRSDTQVQFSFDGGPEFRITSVTEQQAESIAGKYANLSMMALGVFSGRGVQDLRAITAYVTQGKSSWIVNESTGARTYSADSTSYAPDIFADTVLDRDNGIGKYAKSEGIDWNGLALAKRFCKNNGLGTQLFMDGVIADITSWRQFWVENAPFSLLEFARIGGRETLIPAVPTNAAGAANREVNISALFTTGNILEGSYKEEFIDYGDSTQDIIATVIYRETETQDVFPRNASVQVQLSDVAENNAIRQTFDASQFVTLREQAILFGKLVCNQRRHIRRGIEFKTFPTDSPISPGAYIYVDIGLQTWDGITSGVIMEGGELNAPLTDSIANGSYSVLTYKNDQAAQSFTGVGVTNGTAASLASKAGYMFVLGAQSNRKRVFRVTEVQMDEEGEVTVKAMEHPCEAVGSQLLSRIANFSSGLFNVR
jgi:hypothetical protein